MMIGMPSGRAGRGWQRTSRSLWYFPSYDPPPLHSVRRTSTDSSNRATRSSNGKPGNDFTDTRWQWIGPTVRGMNDFDFHTGTWDVRNRRLTD
jgi:hypothetical protein